MPNSGSEIDELVITAGREREAEDIRTAPRKHEPFPDELKRRYYIVDEADVRHVYADPQMKKPIFRDTGEELRAKDPDKTTIRLMLDTAEHRGWQSIDIKGNKDFVREAWLEGSLRGLTVNGYEPSQVDLQELEKRTRAAGREVTAGPELDRAATSPPNQAKTAPEAPARTKQPERPDYKAGISGTVLHMGERPYKDDPKAEHSPYVEMRLKDGQLHRVWGVGLPDALENVKVGDEITLKQNGIETVQKTVSVTGPDGKDTTQTIDVQRRAWSATPLQERNQDEAEIDHITDMAYASNAALNSGPARDVAFTGMSANEDRAMDYMTYGGSAAAATPELASAVATERYIENKLKQAFPNKPAQVERGVAVARHKIASMIRHGMDFPAGREKEKQEEKERDRDDTEKEFERDYLSDIAHAKEDHER